MDLVCRAGLGWAGREHIHSPLAAAQVPGQPPWKVLHLQASTSGSALLMLSRSSPSRGASSETPRSRLKACKHLIPREKPARTLSALPAAHCNPAMVQKVASALGSLSRQHCPQKHPSPSKIRARSVSGHAK